MRLPARRRLGQAPPASPPANEAIKRALGVTLRSSHLGHLRTAEPGLRSQEAVGADNKAWWTLETALPVEPTEPGSEGGLAWTLQFCRLRNQ